MEKQSEGIDTEQETQKGRFLTFLLDKEVYAIEIRLVTEIIRMQPVTELPEMPDYMKGIVNIRGRIIPVIDVRLRFRLKPIDYTPQTCIVMIQVKNVTLGLIVDNVSEVLSILDDKIVPPPNVKNSSENRFVKAIGLSEEKVKLILDCEKLLHENGMETINQIV